MKKINNILIISHYFYPEVNAPANRIYEHAKIWTNNNKKVTIITNNPNHPHGVLYKGYTNKGIKSTLFY